MEQFIDSLIAMNPFWVYLIAAVISFIENIFPPFPSDIILLAAGYLCATGRAEFWIVLCISTFGSAAGFATMYKIGAWFGIRVVETGKLRFLKLEKIHKVEAWFNKYGFFVVVVNRFLAGTRAVIAFFTGMSNLSLTKTLLLATLSSLLWNTLLLYAGKGLGSNWKIISSHLEIYSKIVTILTLLVIALVVLFNRFRKKSTFIS